MLRKHGTVEADIRYALPFSTGDRIVELGGGERPLRVQGMETVNVDIRELPQVDIVRNLEDGFSDIGQFDGLFANYLLEHISWRKVEKFLSDCYKILKPNSHAVFVVPDTYAQAQKILERQPHEIDFGDSCFLFGGQDFSDNTHKWFISRPFLESLLIRAGFDEVRFIDHPDPNARDMFVEAYKGSEKVTGLTKINFGSFTVTYGSGWINCDIRADIKPMVEAKGHLFEYCDVTRPLRWRDDSVDYITHHHLLEHLYDNEGIRFLEECYRILKPNGVMRLSIPNPQTLAKAYLDNMHVLDDESEEVQNAKYNVDAFWTLLTSGHKTLYDFQKVNDVLSSIGFVNVKIVEHMKSEHSVFPNETMELYPKHSLFIEATKTDIIGKPMISLENQKPEITVRKELEPYEQYLEGLIKEGTQ